MNAMIDSLTTKNTRKGEFGDIVLISLYGIENRGIRYLSATLRRNGFRPHQIYFKRWVNNRISPPTERECDMLTDLVRNTRPLVIGFGFGTPYLGIAADLTARLRKVMTTPILWGGIHATICPEDAIEHADILCVGEGEQPMLDLCRALSQGHDITAISNLWVRNGADVKRNDIRPLIDNLDELPFPDYLQPNTWFIEDNRIRAMDPISETAEYRIYPSRGCPYKCAYCYNSTMRGLFKGKGRYYRTRSAANVIRELETARSMFPRIRRIKFDGDVFAFPKPWFREFAQAYAQSIRIPFEILTYPGELDEEDFRLLRKAGLQKIQVGVQSGSDTEVAGVYDRTSTGQDVRNTVAMAQRNGIEVVFDLIFDNPLATRADNRAMIEWLLDVPRPFRVYLYSLTVFPKTRLAADLLERGIITPADIEGRATKSFRQFRLSFDYPRKPEDVFWISLAILTSKNFIPKKIIRRWMDSEKLRRQPWPLRVLAQTADLLKNAFIAFNMMLHGELTLFKLRQYGSFGKIISQ